MTVKKLAIMLVTLVASLPLAWAGDEAIFLQQGHQRYFEGALEEALAAYQRAIEANPNEAEAYLQTAVVCRDLGHYKDAYRYGKEAAKRRPEDATLQAWLGWIAAHQGHRRVALQHFRRSLQFDPENSSAFFGIGETLVKDKAWAQAIEPLLVLTKQRPWFAPAYFVLGEAYTAMGKFQEAIQKYLKTLKEDYNFTEVRLPLARAYERLGNTDEAWKQYVKILDIDPHHPEAKERKEALTPLLTKKPEELIPPKRIAKASIVQPATRRGRIPLLRVGIGTNGKGKPIPKQRLEFRCGGPFTIVSQSAPVGTIHEEGNRLRATYAQSLSAPLVRGNQGALWVIQVSSRAHSACEIVDPQGQVLGTFQETLVITLKHPDTQTIILHDITYGKGFAWAGIQDREYRGTIEVTPHPELGLLLVNTANLEEYLYSVLPSEMSTYWPTEALKAQAVISRSNAQYRRKTIKPHSRYGYDLCDDQHCQVYRGVKPEDQRGRQAVDATRGEVLTKEGKLIHALYSSNCGGHTQSSKELKGWGEVSYLQGMSDAPPEVAPPQSPWGLELWIKGNPNVYCNIPKYCYPAEFRWLRIVPRTELEERLNRKYAIGRLQRLEPGRRSRSGHLNGLRILGSEKTVVLDKENEIRAALGLGFMRSTLMILEPAWGRKGNLDRLFVYGGGWGHAVGLCQSGAAGLAERGASYRKIVRHYYRGVSLTTKSY
ncbi:MAG: SpoIID/LytB domain-containing protein [Elusimicrobia bacterium]|nr:SpoIID/LytB domain-containing protein [Elusimicrobiota bacterium]